MQNVTEDVFRLNNPVNSEPFRGKRFTAHTTRAGAAGQHQQEKNNRSIDTDSVSRNQSQFSPLQHNEFCLMRKIRIYQIVKRFIIDYRPEWDRKINFQIQCIQNGKNVIKRYPISMLCPYVSRPKYNSWQRNETELSEINLIN